MCIYCEDEGIDCDSSLLAIGCRLYLVCVTLEKFNKCFKVFRLLQRTNR